MRKHLGAVSKNQVDRAPLGILRTIPTKFHLNLLNVLGAVNWLQDFHNQIRQSN